MKNNYAKVLQKERALYHTGVMDGLTLGGMITLIAVDELLGDDIPDERFTDLEVVWNEVLNRIVDQIDLDPGTAYDILMRDVKEIRKNRGMEE